MIFGNLFKKKKEKTTKYSEYFSDFYVGKMLTIDPSFDIFIKESTFMRPDFLTITNITKWNIEDDQFEEYTFDNDHYVVVYDVGNQNIYLMEKMSYSEQNIDSDNLSFGGRTYQAVTPTMWTSDDRLLRIFENNISETLSEYLFFRVKKFSKVLYNAVIIQKNFFK